MQLNCLFESSQLVHAAELLILFLFSSSQTEELLLLVHIEFNILAIEFIIVALLYSVYSPGIVILVRTVTYLF